MADLNDAEGWIGRGDVEADADTVAASVNARVSTSEVAARAAMRCTGAS